MLGKDGDVVLAIVWTEEAPMTVPIGEQFNPRAASLIVRRRGSAAVRSRCNRLRAGGAAEIR